MISRSWKPKAFCSRCNHGEHSHADRIETKEFWACGCCGLAIAYKPKLMDYVIIGIVAIVIAGLI